MTVERPRTADQIRRVLIERAVAAFDDAGVQGLCCEGAWEAAISALRRLDLDDPAAPTVLETPRLLLRPFRADDLDPYAALCADPEVMRYVGDRGVLSREDAWRQMAMLAGHWQLRGFGMWAVEERETGAFVGRVGLHYPEGWPGREIAWALARPFWGRGYAMEAARAALGEAFGRLGWPRVISLIDPRNIRSVRLAARLGGRLEGEATVRGHSVAVYAVERSALGSSTAPSADRGLGGPGPPVPACPG